MKGANVKSAQIKHLILYFFVEIFFVTFVIQMPVHVHFPYVLVKMQQTDTFISKQPRRKKLPIIL